MKPERQPAPDSPSDTREQVVRYLLDEMDEGERNSVDERLVSTPEFSDTIGSIEDDLIMQYVRGELKPPLASRFHEVYMNSPAKLARVEKARALRRAVREISAERKPLAARSLRLRLAIAGAVAVVILATVLWPLWRRTSTIEPGKIPYASFSIEPGITRSGEGVQISLPPGIQEVHFELALPNGAALQTYQAVLGTPERPAGWKGQATPRDGRLVAVVPVKALRAGDYTLELQSNSEEVATFYFRVTN